MRGYESLSAISSGDPYGFDLLEEALRTAAEGGVIAGVSAVALLNAYEEGVLLQFHDRTPALHERVSDVMRRHQIDWRRDLEVYRSLELVQRGRYDDARHALAALSTPEHGANSYGVQIWALAMLETRAGSLDRARSLLDTALPDAALNQVWPVALARLELATAVEDPAAAEMAASLYASTEPRRFARGAGMAAVALARASGSAPALPAWLATDSPLRVYWHWATSLAEGDPAGLRAVAGRFTAMTCPYEAALALRDAGDLTAAYRALRDLDARAAREQTAMLLRASGVPVPRRTRAATSPAGLTDTEMEVARLVAGGATNEQAAQALGISTYTVATHLTRIYAKSGMRGRAALASWWSRHAPAAE